MIGLLSLLPLMLLAGIPSSRMGKQDTPSPDRIEVSQLGPWGMSGHEWSIDRQGAVTIRSDNEPSKSGGSATPVTHIIRFSAGAEGYAAVRAILLPVERRNGRPYRCRKPITDAGVATIAWTYGKKTVRYGLDSGCLDKPGDPGWGPFEAADRKISALAEAATDTTSEDKPWTP